MNQRHRITVRGIRARALSFVVASAFVGISAPAHAAFFQLAENNASGLGNAYAGGAAIADDASTVWYNPAGMTRLSGQQFVAAGHFIQPSTEFDKDSANVHAAAGGGAINGGEGGDAGESAIVPNLYYTRQFSSQLFFGLGINAPFGLATDYEDDWVGRYHALRSEITSVNINPAVAFKVNEAVSLGAGVSVQYIEANLTQAVDFGTACLLAQALGQVAAGTCTALSLQPQQDDGHADITADDTSLGYNLGVLWNITDATRLGLAYRSQIKHEVKGDADFDTPNAGAATFASGAGLVDTDASANVTLPATLSLSVFHQINPQWAVMGDVTQTRWSSLPELRIEFGSSASDSVVTLDLENAYRYAVGATFAPGGAWTYRAGVARDETPTPNASVRTARLPDADRTWIALGAGFQPSPSLVFDFGFVHIKADDAEIDKSLSDAENAARGSLVGTYEASVNILSAQANWKF